MYRDLTPKHDDLNDLNAVWDAFTGDGRFLREKIEI